MGMIKGKIIETDIILMPLKQKESLKVLICYSSSPFRLEIDEKRGRHFIATRDIQPLELILR